jgi:hypothetical protein
MPDLPGNSYPFIRCTQYGSRELTQTESNRLYNILHSSSYQKKIEKIAQKANITIDEALKIMPHFSKSKLGICLGINIKNNYYPITLNNNDLLKSVQKLFNEKQKKEEEKAKDPEAKTLGATEVEDLLQNHNNKSTSSIPSPADAAPFLASTIPEPPDLSSFRDAFPVDPQPDQIVWKTFGNKNDVQFKFNQNIGNWEAQDNEKKLPVLHISNSLPIAPAENSVEWRLDTNRRPIRFSYNGNGIWQTEALNGANKESLHPISTPLPALPLAAHTNPEAFRLDHNNIVIRFTAKGANWEVEDPAVRDKLLVDNLVNGEPLPDNASNNDVIWKIDPNGRAIKFIYYSNGYWETKAIAKGQPDEILYNLSSNIPLPNQPANTNSSEAWRIDQDRKPIRFTFNQQDDVWETENPHNLQVKLQLNTNQMPANPFPNQVKWKLGSKKKHPIRYIWNGAWQQKN